LSLWRHNRGLKNHLAEREGRSNHIWSLIQGFLKIL
jgi:hypothetical protein